MQKSPCPRSFVSRPNVVGWKYNAKGSWAKSEKSYIRQCAHCYTTSSPARIGCNPLALRLPAVKRLLQMSRLRQGDHCQNNRENARDRDTLPSARYGSKNGRSELHTDHEHEEKRDYLSRTRSIRQHSGNRDNKNDG